uniref:CD276 antigen n=1 Tax=Canis lupus familiaris TaxID=9615 RepID=A0A8I3S6J3_CANLF
MLRRASTDVGVRLAAALAALWFCITGAVEVQVPEDPVVALVGTDATLRCSFSPEPGFSLAQLNLIWQLTDTKQLVHSFAEGRDQGSAYANRTALFPDLLAQGNASLRLQRVRVADEGSFTCFVSIRDFGSAAVSLQVAAPYSKPSMTLEPSKDLRPGDTVTITCSSYRGYPEAEVLWQDGQGAPLTGNVTTSQMANEQSLFDVRSVLRVVLGANGTYSCLVRNPVLQQDARGSVTITPHRSPTGSLFLFRLCPVREGGFVPSEGLRDWNLAPYLQSPTVVKFLVVMTGKVNGVRRRGLTLLGREDSRHGPSPPLGLLTPGLRTPLERMEEHSDLPRDSKDRRGNGSISRWGFARAGYCPRPAPPSAPHPGIVSPRSTPCNPCKMGVTPHLEIGDSVCSWVWRESGKMDKDLGVNRGGSLGSWGRIGWHGPAPRHRPTPCPPGAVEVQVPEDPVVALVGTDATLCCSFSPEPGFSLAQLNLIWQLTDTKQLVHSFAEGRDQGSAYANRTALFPDLLAQGNASLRLQRVRVADEGSFTCFVSIRDFGSAAVSLQVAAPYSKPSMTLEPSKDLRPGDTVTITCSSYRGYPEAEVLWQDGQGAPLTGNVTTSQMANEQGLFDVRSVLRVVLGANGTYSCLVRNPVLQQDAHGSVTITGRWRGWGGVGVRMNSWGDAGSCCLVSKI